MLRALLLVVALSACKQPPTPAPFSDFVAKPGVLAPACVVSNHGKRFVVEGKILFGDVRVGDGIATLDVSNDAESLQFQLDAVVDDQVSFAVTDEKADWRVGGTRGKLNDVTLRTTRGAAHPGDPLRVTFEASVTQHFQTRAPTACTWKVVEFAPRS